MLSLLGMSIFGSFAKSVWHGNSFGWAMVVAVALLCWATSGAWGPVLPWFSREPPPWARATPLWPTPATPRPSFTIPPDSTNLNGPRSIRDRFFNYPDREFSGEGWTLGNQPPNIPEPDAPMSPSRCTTGWPWGSVFFRPSGWARPGRPNWEGRYITTFSSLKTYNLNPVVSVKVLENLSLAAGFDVMWSKVELKAKSPVRVCRFAPGLPDGENHGSTVDGNGVRLQSRAAYEPVSGVKLGVSYRSQH